MTEKSIIKTKVFSNISTYELPGMKWLCFCVPYENDFLVFDMNKVLEHKNTNRKYAIIGRWTYQREIKKAMVERYHQIHQKQVQ